MKATKELAEEVNRKVVRSAAKLISQLYATYGKVKVLYGNQLLLIGSEINSDPVQRFICVNRRERFYVLVEPVIFEVSIKTANVTKKVRWWKITPGVGNVRAFDVTGKLILPIEVELVLLPETIN